MIRSGALFAAALAISSAPSLVQACTSTYGANVEPAAYSTYQNVGLYAWDGSSWVLVSASYDPYFESETLGTDDIYVQPTSFWGGSGGGGGGGGTYQPQAVGERGEGRGRGQRPGDPSIACTEPVMPEVTVVGHSPAYGGTLLQLAWRGQLLSNTRGGGVAMRAVQPAVNDPNNRTPATCQSDAMTREAHAQDDGRYVRAVWQATGRGYPRAGQAFRVTFDDGGSEVYIWSGMSAPFSHALEGSLQCPRG
jgi:hypothetical protein